MVLKGWHKAQYGGYMYNPKIGKDYTTTYYYMTDSYDIIYKQNHSRVYNKQRLEPIIEFKPKNVKWY